MIERLWKRMLRRRGLTWWHLPAAMMWLGSLVYRVLYRLRRSLAGPPLRVPVPVISVGNITVGGTGKTPLVACLTGDLIAEGLRVGVVSSGYGRRHKGYSFVEPGYRVQQMPTDDTGDEVKLLAGLLPNAVFSVDRVKAQAARRLAEADAVDVIVVDDGFQHWRLARDIDIVTFDAAVPERVLTWFPLGLLREPLTALDRADIVVATRANFSRHLAKLLSRLAQLSPRAQVYSARFVLTELIGRDQRLELKYLEDKSVLLFAGVGNFAPLRKQVAALCADLDVALELRDHQRYDHRTLTHIKRLADQHDSDVILTTGKDWAKLPDFAFGRDIYYLGQSVDLDPGEERLVQFLRERLKLSPREN